MAEGGHKGEYTYPDDDDDLDDVIPEKPLTMTLTNGKVITLNKI